MDCREVRGEMTSHDEDDIVDRDPGGEDERDGEGGGELPAGAAHSEDFNRVEGILRTVGAGGVIVRYSSSHQEVLEML